MPKQKRPGDMDSTSIIPSGLNTETSFGAEPPLTTTFTPPSSCLASTEFWSITEPSGAYYVQGPRASQSKCFPPSYTPLATAYYSPGICPSGYTAACSWSKVIEPLTETHYTCCPSFASTTFSCRGADNNVHPWDSTLGCVSYFTAPITIDGGIKTLSGNVGTSATTSPGIITPSASTGTIHALSVHVATQSSTPSSSSPATKNNTSTTSHSGVAIGVGVGVGVAVLLGVVFGYLIWRHRKTKKAEAEKQAYSSIESPTPEAGSNHGHGGGGSSGMVSPPRSYYPEGGVTSVTPSSGLSNPTPQSMLMTGGGGYQIPPVEMSALAEPAELPPNRAPTELPTSYSPDGTSLRPVEIG